MKFSRAGSLPLWTLNAGSRRRPVSHHQREPHPQSRGFSGRHVGLFFCLAGAEMHISQTHNQMNKYDLKIYKSPVKVSPLKRDRTLRIANTVQGIF
jgi:hypothetical protein